MTNLIDALTNLRDSTKRWAYDNLTTPQVDENSRQAIFAHRRLGYVADKLDNLLTTHVEDLATTDYPSLKSWLESRRAYAEEQATKPADRAYWGGRARAFELVLEHLPSWITPPTSTKDVLTTINNNLDKAVASHETRMVLDELITKVENTLIGPPKSEWSIGYTYGVNKALMRIREARDELFPPTPPPAPYKAYPSTWNGGGGWTVTSTSVPGFTDFIGTNAEQRARAYADYLNGVGTAPPQ